MAGRLAAYTTAGAKIRHERANLGGSNQDVCHLAHGRTNGVDYFVAITERGTLGWYAGGVVVGDRVTQPLTRALRLRRREGRSLTGESLGRALIRAESAGGRLRVSGFDGHCTLSGTTSFQVASAPDPSTATTLGRSVAGWSG
ncbi:hypothetical protein CSOJ01_06761 [Colletotrichum sojae]|uniref:Uncharacterized protein n=1 Tax=Colletotrichum sojae TaxID=2175907 RepID=A0A8H6JBS7_9PEZI|nr:hypothetical protein CSOJ01_06761 [Colletotrichum sojae]